MALRKINPEIDEKLLKKKPYDIENNVPNKFFERNMEIKV